MKLPCSCLSVYPFYYQLISLGMSICCSYQYQEGITDIIDYIRIVNISSVTAHALNS